MSKIINKFENNFEIQKISFEVYFDQETNDFLGDINGNKIVSKSYNEVTNFIVRVVDMYVENGKLSIPEAQIVFAAINNNLQLDYDISHLIPNANDYSREETQSLYNGWNKDFDEVHKKRIKLD